MISANRCLFHTGPHNLIVGQLHGLREDFEPGVDDRLIDAVIFGPAPPLLLYPPAVCIVVNEVDEATDRRGRLAIMQVQKFIDQLFTTLIWVP